RTDQFPCCLRHVGSSRHAVLVSDVPAFDISQAVECFTKRFDPRIKYGVRSQHANALETGPLLRAGREPASDGSEECNSRTQCSDHRITSSARSRIDSGMVTLSAFAVVKLITSV